MGYISDLRGIVSKGEGTPILWIATNHNNELAISNGPSCPTAVMV